MPTNTPTNATREKSPLVREFLTDHQLMSKLLTETVAHLEKKNDAAALASAIRLDKVAGPHIAYEESELYPRISGEKLMSDTTRAMYDEHREAALALKRLLDSSSTNGPLQEAQRQQIIAGLKTGITHAEHCGSLISLLDALPAPEQEESLANLLEYRERGRSWTERVR